MTSAHIVHTFPHISITWLFNPKLGKERKIILEVWSQWGELGMSGKKEKKQKWNLRVWTLLEI